jgi:hypothetical protein
MGAFSGAAITATLEVRAPYDKGDELGVFVLVEWLSEAVSGHADAREVIELDSAVLVQY